MLPRLVFICFRGCNYSLLFRVTSRAGFVCQEQLIFSFSGITKVVSLFVFLRWID